MRHSLQSWNDGAARQSIIEFIAAVTCEGAPSFVLPSDRIAVFDSDGTLWAEKPIDYQLQFAIDRVRELADEHPEWKTKQPFKAALEGDYDTLARIGGTAAITLTAPTHVGKTTHEFTKTVAAWLAKARHPRFDRPYTDLVYQPMLELIRLLRTHSFKTYIVSGCGADFMRIWSDRVYGIPPEHVIGSTVATRFEIRHGLPVLVREDKIDFLDVCGGKPVGIDKFIGRRPIFAFGNSDSDLAMLQWTAAGNGPSLMGLVHHTDGNREWAYDRGSGVDHLDEALGNARTKGWTLVDMKRDWNRVFSFEE